MLIRYLRRLFGLLSHVRDTLVSQGPDRVFFLAVRYLSWKIQFQKRVSTLPPRVNLVITTLVLTWVRFTLRLFRLLMPDKYTDADPYKCIWVDPSEIKYTTGDTGSKRRGWVVDGNWDLTDSRFMDRTAATAIEQRFVDGLSWEETVLAEGNDEDEFKQRCHTIDRLYQAIRKGGYKSQQQLLDGNSKTVWYNLNDAIHPLANEIFIDIGRNGELLWNMCGQHRLAIAKVLDIDRIPVQVFRRHKEWQTIRERIRDDKYISKNLTKHPDLDDLLNED